MNKHFCQRWPRYKTASSYFNSYLNNVKFCVLKFEKKSKSEKLEKFPRTPDTAAAAGLAVSFSLRLLE